MWLLAAAAYNEEETTLQKAGEQAKLPVKDSASTESLLNAEDQPPPG